MCRHSCAGLLASFFSPVSTFNVYENYRDVPSSGGTSVSLDSFISVVKLDTTFTSSYKYKRLVLLSQQ